LLTLLNAYPIIDSWLINDLFLNAGQVSGRGPYKVAQYYRGSGHMEKIKSSNSGILKGILVYTNGV